jgi:ParB family transcriptional regulator, chromosome partitioning protein
MKRKDLVNALLSADLAPAPSDTVDPKPARVAAGSVRAMGLELHRLTEQADEAQVLRQQIENGSIVAELDPEMLEPSFVSDRLTPIDDPQYRQLVESIRKDGQALPVLVRPHPDRTGIYQIAYGHRRWHAARELAVKVRAIIQTLSDTELVIAQGKENAERRNLSFIERALFAAKLDSNGFDRATINAALAVHTTELSRLLTVAAAIPSAIVTLIGPAPKAGRTRWIELVEYLQTKDAQQLAVQTLDSPSLKRLGTDARFEALMETLRNAASGPEPTEVIANARGEPVVRITRSGRGLRVWVDGRFGHGFGAYLVRSLPDLIHRFDTETDQVRDQ